MRDGGEGDGILIIPICRSWAYRLGLELFLKKTYGAVGGAGFYRWRPMDDSHAFTSKQGQALLENSLWPWTVASGNSSCSCSTSARSEAFCAAVRVSLGLPFVDRPPI